MEVMGNAPALSLEIRWNGREIAGTRVESSRPVFASRLLEGRSASEALGTVSRLFSVCRRAQAVAARVACQMASEGSTEPASMREGELEVLAEHALESIWWLLLEGPTRIGETPRPGDFPRLRSRVLGSIDRVRDTPWAAIASDIESFLASPTYRQAVERLMRELRAMDMPAVAVEPLPWLDPRALREEMAPAIEARADFPRTPSWHGRAAETGALARAGESANAAHAIGARVEARLAELVGIPSRMRALCAGAEPSWVRCAIVDEGEGISAVETARGTLVHAVRIEDGTVRRWRIVAPTEWNFHPEGAFVRALEGLPAASASEAARAAERLAYALDPCIEYRVGVVHA
jgi:hypothetical protein